MTTATMALPAQTLTGNPTGRIDRALKPFLWVLLISLFLPTEVSVNVAGLEMTAIKVVSILFFFFALARNLIRLHWTDLCLWSIYVSMFLSVANQGDTDRAVQATGRMFLETGVPFYIARVVGQRQELLLWFMKRLIAILAIMSFTVMYESATGTNINQLFWSPLTGVTPQIGEVRLGGVHRAWAWSRHPIMLGLAYAMAVPCAVLMWLEPRRYGFRHGTIQIVLLLAAVFCTVSFGTWTTLGLILGLLFYDWAAGRWLRLPPRTRWVLAGSVLALWLTILQLTSTNPLLMVLMYNLHGHEGAWIYRWQLFERVYDAMGDNWLLGYGERIPEQFSSNYGGWSVDNHYLVTLLLYGQVGLVTWISVHLAAFWTNIWNTALAARELPGATMARSFGIVLLGMMLAQIFVCFFSTALTLNFMFIGFAVGQALYIRSLRRAALSPGTPGSPGSPGATAAATGINAVRRPNPALAQPTSPRR